MEWSISGDPSDPQHSDASFRRSMDELLPHVERYGLELNLEAHLYDFIELSDAAVDLVRGIKQTVRQLPLLCPCSFQPKTQTVATPSKAYEIDRRMLERVQAELTPAPEPN
jgi:hypothetical protein